MNYYKNTSPDWGANWLATLEDYMTLAKRYQEDDTEEGQEEVKPELLTADEKHVYYDGKPIADRIAGPDEWQCARCGAVYDESLCYAEVKGGYLCEECAIGTKRMKETIR
jgi:rubredoxin